MESFQNGPLRTAIHHLRHKCLAALNVRGRMLVIFRLEPADQAKGRIYERYLRQRAHAGHAGRLGQEQLQRKKVRIRRSCQPDGAEGATLRKIRR